MDFQLITFLEKIISKKVPNKYINIFQEFLLSAGFYKDANRVLAFLLTIILFLTFVVLLFILISASNFLFLFTPLMLIPLFIAYILIKKEKRAEIIEKSAPDFLRQLASILKVGLSFENSMENISTYGCGPLYDEIKRTIFEIKVGGNFDEAWMNMAYRLNSKELEKTFMIILESRKSGSSISNVIEDVSKDLREILILKRERKSSVMMAVMFLIISAVIASPFSIGMISIYGKFMNELGKMTEFTETAIFAGQAYLLIHSIIVGIIIGIVLYGNAKKGIKFSLILLLVSYGIFYLISYFGTYFFNFGV